MSRSLKLYISWLVSFSALALLLTSYLFAQFVVVNGHRYVLGIRYEFALTLTSSPQINVLLGLAFWIVITLFAGALPVRMPRGTFVSVSSAPVITAMVLGGPVAAGWVALIGTTELRELRGEVPWYGTAANHAGMVLPAVVGGLVFEYMGAPLGPDPTAFLATMVGGTVVFIANVTLVAIVVALRSSQRLRVVMVGDAKGFATSQVALAPLSWLMAQV